MRLQLPSIIVALFLIAGCDAAVISACTPSDNVICDITRPEDIEQVPNSSWILVSEGGQFGKSGRIQAINLDNGRRQVVIDKAMDISDHSSFPRCGAVPQSLHPRGIHLSYDSAGELSLLIVSAGRVEKFHVLATAAGVTAKWDGCVTIPDGILANDVAGFRDDGFVVSHMFDLPRTFWVDLRFLLGLNTGYAMGWSAEGGWQRIPNTEASFANGIQVDPTTSRIFVSSMFTQRVISVDRDGQNRVQSGRTPSQIDNLSWAPDGRLIGTGHTGFPVYGVSACRNIGDKSCSFPFAVIGFDPASLSHHVLFEVGTGDIPGASVAALHEGSIFLGTAYGDRISRVSTTRN